MLLVKIDEPCVGITCTRNLNDIHTKSRVSRTAKPGAQQRYSGSTASYA